MRCDNKIRGSHRRCLAANKCLSVRGLLKEVEGNNGGPLPSPVVLSIVRVRERKPRYKKMKGVPIIPNIFKQLLICCFCPNAFNF